MIWSAFKTYVRKFLLRYNDLLEAQQYIDTQLVAAVADLQRTIPALQVGHVDTYTEADVVLDGYASRGATPNGRIDLAYLRKINQPTEGPASLLVQGAGISAVNGLYTPVDTFNGQTRWYLNGDTSSYSIQFDATWFLVETVGEDTYAVKYSLVGDSPFTSGVWDGPDTPAPTSTTYVPDTEIELGVTQVGSDEFRAMRGGGVDQPARIFIDTNKAKFWATPQLNSEMVLILEWRGVKTSFSDADETPFNEEEAHVVAEYLLARLTRSIDKDLRQSQAHEAAYLTLKRKLHSDYNARSFISIESRTVGYQPED